MILQILPGGADWIVAGGPALAVGLAAALAWAMKRIATLETKIETLNKAQAEMGLKYLAFLEKKAG